MSLRHFWKRNCHAPVLRQVVRLGRSLYRFYENRNYDHESNGEYRVLRILSARPCATVFDVGANVGQWTTLASPLFPRARFFCFEPAPAAFQQLRRLEVPGRIHTLQLGLSEHAGRAPFHLYEQGHALSSLHSYPFHAERPLATEITLITGDEVMAAQGIGRVDLLKIDAEGHDLHVLKGFAGALRGGNVGAIQFEYGRINIVSKALLYDFDQFLGSVGYRIGKIYPKSVEFRDYAFEMEDFIGPNFLAVPRSEPDLIRALA